MVVEYCFLCVCVILDNSKGLNVFLCEYWMCCVVHISVSYVCDREVIIDNKYIKIQGITFFVFNQAAHDDEKFQYTPLEWKTVI